MNTFQGISIPSYDYKTKQIAKLPSFDFMQPTRQNPTRKKRMAIGMGF
jgi:hypothetical protein